MLYHFGEWVGTVKLRHPVRMSRNVNALWGQEIPRIHIPRAEAVLAAPASSAVSHITPLLCRLSNGAFIFKVPWAHFNGSLKL
jgi:hypothetical protein